MSPVTAEPATSAPAAPEARWGLGDVWLGLAMFAGATAAVVAAVLIDRRGGSSTSADVDGWSLATILLINVVVFIGVPLLTARRKGTGSLRRDYGLSFRRSDILVGLGGGFVAVVFSATGAAIVAAALGHDVQTRSLENVSGIAQRIAVHLVLAGLVPVAEELFFRGLLLRSFLRRNGPALSLAATTALFSLLHIAGTTSLGAAQATAIVSAAISGLVYGLLTLGRNGRIGAAIIAHIVVNQTALFFAFG